MKFTEEQMKEIEEVVSFTADGKMNLKRVTGNVDGDVGGEVWGDVKGDVKGSVWGKVWGDVKGDVKARVSKMWRAKQGE
jgi:hypothetical protein